MGVRLSHENETGASPPPAPQRRFRYVLDPLFLLASGLYVLNRVLFKPNWGGAFPFLRNHLDDCLLISAALPVLLWVFRKLGLRNHDFPPTRGEVLQWTVLWAATFEWAFPRFLGKGTADWRDALCYAAGAALACWLWEKASARSI